MDRMAIIPLDEYNELLKFKDEVMHGKYPVKIGSGELEFQEHNESLRLLIVENNNLMREKEIFDETTRQYNNEIHRLRDKISCKDADLMKLRQMLEECRNNNKDK